MPESPEPLVRARFCQEWLAFVEQEEEPWRGRLLAKIDSGLRETIETASRVAWLPMRLHVTLADRLHEAFGVARAHAYYRRAFASSLSGPVLGPLMRTGARVLGLSPATFVRWAPRGWDAGFRNAGQLSGEVLGPGRARLVYRDLPEVCTESDAWMQSSQGSAYGAFDILRVEGVVRLDLRGRKQGGMTLELEWVERGA